MGIQSWLKKRKLNSWARTQKKLILFDAYEDLAISYLGVKHNPSKELIFVTAMLIHNLIAILVKRTTSNRLDQCDRFTADFVRFAEAYRLDCTELLSCHIFSHPLFSGLESGYLNGLKTNGYAVLTVFDRQSDLYWDMGKELTYDEDGTIYEGDAIYEIGCKYINNLIFRSADEINLNRQISQVRDSCFMFREIYFDA